MKENDIFVFTEKQKTVCNSSINKDLVGQVFIFSILQGLRPCIGCYFFENEIKQDKISRCPIKNDEYLCDLIPTTLGETIILKNITDLL